MKYFVFSFFLFCVVGCKSPLPLSHSPVTIDILKPTTPFGLYEDHAERIIGINIQVNENDSNEYVFKNIRFSDISETILTKNLVSTKQHEKAVWDEGLFKNFKVNRKLVTTPTLKKGDNYFWLIGKVDFAEEGNLATAAIESIKINNTWYKFTENNTVERVILLNNQTVFSPGAFNSNYYRIPALATAKDGSLLAAIDARHNNQNDLPNDIDIYVRRSTDNGKTWSEAITVADFGDDGASDPALVVDEQTGDVLLLFASHNGLWNSTKKQPIRFNVARSVDNGKTWQEPIDFSDDVYAENWNACWIASGSASQDEDGRIMALAGIIEDDEPRKIKNAFIYSDDHGKSWNYSPELVTQVGDEAKVIQLNNGDYLANIRNQDPNLRKIVLSKDRGKTWGEKYYQEELIDPFVNGDLIRYSSSKTGKRDILLFSIASHPTNRENLTVFASFDEGKTWPVSKVIHQGGTAYSSLTKLQDGTIGVLYENTEFTNGLVEIDFVRFSLNWLLDE